MKYLVVFALCATAAFAEIIVDSKLLENFRTECASLHNVNLDSIHNAESVAALKSNCFFECYGKKMGMIKEDGTYDIEALLVNAQTPEEKEVGRKNIDLVYKKCSADAGDDHCKMANCFVAITGP